jgi:hypothetical protein
MMIDQNYVASWVDLDFTTCFQRMAIGDERLFEA